MKENKTKPANFYNRRGQPISASSVTATHVKNEFGRVLEGVIKGSAVVITKHNVPKAVLVSFDEFKDLALGPDRRLATLRDEFDALLAQMQSPKARAGMKAAFGASPKQLGKAAVKAARKRG